VQRHGCSSIRDAQHRRTPRCRATADAARRKGAQGWWAHAAPGELLVNLTGVSDATQA
jgi:hypothetical protein